MWLTEAEIKTHSRSQTLPTSVHLSLAPGATRAEALEEFGKMQEAIMNGGATAMKSLDHGTISFRKTYQLLRELGWGRLRAVRVSGYRKVANIIKTHRV